MIVGLGNPGLRYRYTKHNLGFQLLEHFASNEQIDWKSERRFQSKFGQKQLGEVTLLLLMPETYMNLSGSAVQKCMAYYKIARQDVLIVCDDVDLPFTELRLRHKGSSGGHNGLQNVIDHIRSSEISRLRLGVGRDVEKPLEEDVVSPLTKSQLEELAPFLDKGCAAIKAFLSLPIDKAMEQVGLLNKMNERKVDEERQKPL